MATRVTRGDREINRRTLWLIRLLTPLIVVGAAARMLPVPSTAALAGVAAGGVIAGAVWYYGLVRVFSEPTDES